MTPKTLALLGFDKVRDRLADCTSFSGGRQLALGLTPGTDADDVRQRLARTSQARDYQDRRGGPELGGAHDVREVVAAARRGRVLLPQELLDVRDTIGAARRMRRPLAREAARWPELAALGEQLDDCPALFDAIQATLNDDGEVLDSASPALGKIRRELRVVHDRLMRHLEKLVASTGARDYLQEALITQRGGRYVLPVKAGFRAKLPGVVHDTSDSGATVFVEPLAVVEQGNRLRELEIEEEREVQRVLRELSGDVATEGEALDGNVAALAELDLAFAAAEYAQRLRAVAPEVVAAERPYLDFRRARHPLLDPATVVPIDIWVGRDFHVLVITGPNTGGKTVSLKTVGLLVLMAQSGLHIPAADGATLTVFDGVHADIGDEQSIEQSLSTFSGHLTNIIAILTAVDSGSLVLLDELGAGTDPVEGAALARALLDHLRERGVTTVASTHYSELKAYAHGTPGVANASVEFDVETLRPTYELTIGLPGRSNALAIARRLGLPGAIVDSASAEVGTPSLDMEELLGEIRSTRRSAQEDRDAAAAAREQAEAWARTLETGVRDIETERVTVLNEARVQAERELALARETIKALLKRAEGAGNRQAAAEVSAQLDEVAAVLTEREASQFVSPSVTPAALAPGAAVRVLSFDQVGEVIGRRGDNVDVQLGRMRVTVPVQDLEVIARPAAPALESGADIRHLRAGGGDAHVPIELNLRGMRVEDGLSALDAYLDSAVLSGLPWVRIIHGHGTGAMKSAVRDALKHHPSVRRYRAGNQGEGGDGATVVYFD